MIECSICGNKTFNLKFHYLKKPKKETDFKINKKKYERFYIECKKCLHLFSLMSFDLNNLYSKNYSKLTYGKKILKVFHKINNLPNHKSDNYFRVKRFNKFFIQKNKIKGKFIDIGSGTGIFPYMLKKLGLNIDCIEPDENLKKHIVRNLSLNLVKNNYKSIRLKAKYDVISINKVLEHLDNPKNFLNNILLILKNDGYIYFEVPDAQKAAKFGKNREELFIEHIQGFSKKSIKLFFNSNKFSIKNLKSIKEPSGKFTLYGFAKKII